MFVQHFMWAMMYKRFQRVMIIYFTISVYIKTDKMGKQKSRNQMPELTWQLSLLFLRLYYKSNFISPGFIQFLFLINSDTISVTIAGSKICITAILNKTTVDPSTGAIV